MGEMLGRSNLIDDIDLNALIVEDYIECNLPNGVESDSLVVCNVSSSCFDGDHDDIPDGCNPSAGGGGTSTDANADDSSIPEEVKSSVAFLEKMLSRLSAVAQLNPAERSAPVSSRHSHRHRHSHAVVAAAAQPSSTSPRRRLAQPSRTLSSPHSRSGVFVVTVTGIVLATPPSLL
nr:hypothetical protein Iba_chr12dCG7980 [Ipomoea batatas]